MGAHHNLSKSKIIMVAHRPSFIAAQAGPWSMGQMGHRFSKIGFLSAPETARWGPRQLEAPGQSYPSRVCALHNSRESSPLRAQRGDSPWGRHPAGHLQPPGGSVEFSQLQQSLLGELQGEEPTAISIG